MRSPFVDTVVAIIAFGMGIDKSNVRYVVHAARPKTLEHSQQELPPGPCGACDICLGEVELLEDGLETGQKILSCILRLRARFGGRYMSAVLAGSREKRILE